MPKYFKASKSRSNHEGGRLFFFGLTHAGGAYLTFVLLVSLAAVRAGNNALYTILAVLLSAVIVSGIISRNTLKQLALRLQTPDRIFAGMSVATRVSLTNTKRLFPSFAIYVNEMKPDAKNTPEKQRGAVFFPVLRAGETRSARLEQTFTRRGRRRQTLEVATRFPFGFFRRRYALPSQEMLVYPEIGKIPEFLRISVLSGRRESRLHGTGENFYSIREYHDGESARSIDWKATAKARKLMAREYASDAEFRCLLILDTRALPEKGDSESVEKKERADELFEKAVSLAAGLAAQFIKDGAALEFLASDVHIPSGSGDGQLYKILEALAVTSIFHANSATAQSVMPDAADLQKMISDQTFSIILTPRPEESFPVGIRRFARIVSV